MADPAIEKIAKNIEADINLITTGNGFNETLRAVRHRRVDYGIDKSYADKDVVIKQAEWELLQKGLMVDKRQTFELTIILIDIDTETASIDTRINTVASDVEKKLEADLTRGGFALDTSVVGGGTMVDGGDGGPGGIILTITVDYRHVTGDPFTQ